MKQLRKAVRGDDELRETARRLAKALGGADYDRLRRAVKKNDLQEIADALGLSVAELDSVMSFLAHRSEELARQFPDLRKFRPEP